MNVRSIRAALFLTTALAASAAATDWVAYYAERVAAFTKENATLDARTKYVVLVGDSLTEGFSAPKVKRFLPTVGARTLNRGISSDGVGVNARGVLNRLDASVFACRPGHVFLLIGVNDLGKDGKGVDAAARAYDKVVHAIREKAKDVPLVVVTLAPTCGSHASMNPGIVRYNEKIVAIARANGCAVIDLHAKLVGKDGALPEAMATKDGLHWKDGVYEVLGAEIERVVAGK